MRYRGGQFNVPHTFAANFSERNFNATFFADNATMLQALVFAAQAFVVFDGSKNFGAKQAIAFWLERAVVNGFRFFDFAKRPGANTLRRRKADLDRIELFVRGRLFEQV